MNRRYLIAGVVYLVSLAATGGAAYLVARKQLEKQFDQQLRQEIETTKNFYKTLHKKGEFETPAAAVEKLIPPSEVKGLLDGGGEFSEDPHAAAAAKVLTQYGGHNLSTRSIVTVEKAENIFTKAADDDSDAAWEREKRDRTEEAPYIISMTEYMENETDFEQVSFSYYSGDGILTDDQDNRIEDIDAVVGDYNLVKFGHHSSDPRVVYVRNEERSLDIEITQNDGKYSEIVQGLG